MWIKYTSLTRVYLTKYTSLTRKIGGDFERLPALDAKYHQRASNQNVFKELQESCFEELIEQITWRLQSGRALLLVDLLYM